MSITNKQILVGMWNNGDLTFGFPTTRNGLVSCEIVEGEEGLPRLHIVCHETHFLYFSNLKEAKKAGVGGDFIALAQAKSPDDQAIASHMWEKNASHFWLCNFRRYGWSWTRDESGDHGYCYGDVWPNGDSCLGYETPEQMIRGSFVRSWEGFMAKNKLPFGLSAYEPVIALPAMRLLNEALKNALAINTARQCLEGVQKQLVKEAKEKGLI